MKVREVITYKNYFEEFFKAQVPKVRDKIVKILDFIEYAERIPSTYLKYMKGQTVCLKCVYNWGTTYSVCSVSSMETGLWFC